MKEINDRASWFKGGTCACSTPPPIPGRVYRLVLLGAPGAGKGTQAELLRVRLGACHLSTGDVFRAAKGLDQSELTPELEESLEHMRRGELIPDDIVLRLMEQRGRCLRCRGGFLLDGFPRTVEQAGALEAMLERENLALTAAIHYSLPTDQVIARLSGRRTCPNCKETFHLVSKPPAKEGICDHCGTRLVQREDDQPAAIRVRMHAYDERASPLLDFYRCRGLLIEIEAEDSPAETCRRTLAALAAPALAEACV